MYSQGVSFLRPTPLAMAISLFTRHTVNFNPCPQHVLLSTFLDCSCKLRQASIPGLVRGVRPSKGEAVSFRLPSWSAQARLVGAWGRCCTVSSWMKHCQSYSGDWPVRYFYALNIWHLKTRNVCCCTMTSLPHSCSATEDCHSASAHISSCWNQVMRK